MDFLSFLSPTQWYGFLIGGGIIIASRFFRYGLAGATGAQALRGSAGGGGGSSGKVQFAKWMIVALFLAAGLAFSWGAVPMANAAFDWLDGRLSGWLSAILTGVLLWGGWHAISGLVGLVRDLLDKEPDEQARTSALTIPTLLPLGGSAWWELMSNPQGASTFVGAAIASALSAYYMHRIWQKVEKAKTGQGAWSWIIVVAAFVVGAVHVPLLIYINGFLPTMISNNDVVTGIRIFFGLVWFVLLAWFVGDCVRDLKKPELPTFAFMMYGPSTVFVFGAFLAVGWDSTGGEVLANLAGA